MTEDAGQLAYRFNHAVTVAMDKQAEIDRHRVDSDVVKLRELHRTGRDVNTVRAAKAALGCGQQRAKAALHAFQAAEEDSREPAA